MTAWKVVLQTTPTYLIAAIWLVNGLYCKVLGYVPRHEQIVGRILGQEHAHVLTVAIGFSEIGMAVWVIIRIRPKLCTWTQIGLVLVMNMIEFIYASDLLLFGQLNALNALLFAGALYYIEFIARPKLSHQRT